MKLSLRTAVPAEFRDSPAAKHRGKFRERVAPAGNFAGTVPAKQAKGVAEITPFGSQFLIPRTTRQVRGIFLLMNMVVDGCFADLTLTIIDGKTTGLSDRIEDIEYATLLVDEDTIVFYGETYYLTNK